MLITLLKIAVIITDEEYPVRPAFSLLTKILDDFTAKVPQSSYSNPSSISFPDINTYIQKYQDPRQADTIMRVQQELDETKIVLVSVGSIYCFWLGRIESGVVWFDWLDASADLCVLILS